MKTGSTKVYALFGDPVAHSLSPAMQNAAFSSLGLDCCYVPFRVRPEDLPTAVAALRALGMGGANVTIPHKERIVSYLDEVDAEAALIGAVNTIVNREGWLVGYNTDGRGFLEALAVEAGFSPEGKAAVLLGAGGAARACAFALALKGARHLFIFNRTPYRAAALADELRAKTGCSASAAGLHEEKILRQALEEADLVVHASPVGMHPHAEDPPIIDPALLKPHLLVCDLVYNPPETKLLRLARAAGCRVVGGVGMLVHQGALAFSLWTGREAPVGLMRQVVEEFLERRESGKENGSCCAS